MNWLSNVRMAYKILCLVLVAAVGLAAVSFTGFSSLRQSQDNVSTVVNVYLPARQELADNELNMRKMQSAMLEAIATADPSRHQKMHNDIEDKYAQDYGAAWEKYKELLGSQPDTQDIIKQTETDWKNYHETALAVVDLTIKGQIEDASKLYGDRGIKTLNALKTDLANLKDNCDAIAAQTNTDNDAAASRSKTLMTIISVVAFIVLFLAQGYITHEITSELKRMMAACEAMKDGDFRSHDDGAGRERGDEFGRMWNALLGVRENLSKLMSTFHEGAEQLAAASEELTATSEQSANGVEQMAATMETTAAAVTQQQASVADSTQAMGQVADSIDHIQHNADRVAHNSRRASERAGGGNQAVDTAVQQMKDVEGTVRTSADIVGKLGERSQEIGQIVDTITEIADQTNLLALNAAIEAARAGEAGRGFSVVADEVRKLAEASQEAAGRIAGLIQSIQQDTNAAVDSMQSGRTQVAEGAKAVEGLKQNFREITDLVDQTSAQMQEIAAAIAGVSQDTDAVKRNISELDISSQQIAQDMEGIAASTEERKTSAQEIAKASNALAQQAQRMQEAIRVFKL